MDKLRSHLRLLLQKQSNLTSEDLDLLDPYLLEGKLNKNKRLFLEGELYEKVVFLYSGLVKKVYTTYEGKELIKEFSCEGELLAPYYSLLLGGKASFSVVAIEDIHFLTIPWSTLADLYNGNIRWMEFGRRIAELHLIKREKREMEFLKYSATERYELFIRHYPHLVPRVTNKDIASFLGISPVSLSRIIATMKD